MRFGVTLPVQFWPSAQPSNPALTNRRPQRPRAQPCCLFQLTQAYWSQACLPARLRDPAWAHTSQPERSDGSDSRLESRAQRHRRLFFWSFDWQPFWARCCSQCSSLYGLTLAFTRTLVSWLNPPPSSSPPPTPFPHTHSAVVPWLFH